MYKCVTFSILDFFNNVENVFRMNQELVWLVHTIHCKAAENVYKIIHTREYVIEDPGFSIKLPMATLRANLMLMQE